MADTHRGHSAKSISDISNYSDLVVAVDQVVLRPSRKVVVDLPSPPAVWMKTRAIFVNPSEV